MKENEVIIDLAAILEELWKSTVLRHSGSQGNEYTS